MKSHDRGRCWEKLRNVKRKREKRKFEFERAKKVCLKTNDVIKDGLGKENFSLS
jgi:hypothetical protein